MASAVESDKASGCGLFNHTYAVGVKRDVLQTRRSKSGFPRVCKLCVCVSTVVHYPKMSALIALRIVGSEYLNLP